MKPEKIDTLIDSFLSDRGFSSSVKESYVINNWKTIVGEQLSQYATSPEIRDGKLYVRVASSSWRHELTFFKKMIIEKIRKTTDCLTIEEIIFY